MRRRMAVLPVRLYPNMVLTKKADLVKGVDADTEKLIADMAETMVAVQGVGLAAPQVDISRRVIVISMLDKNAPHKYLELINPEIISGQGDVIAEEGCLSVKGYTANVKRYQQVKVGYIDRAGVYREMEAQDLLARILQHEIDHLNGILFFEHLSKIKRDLIKKRLQKQARHPIERD
jgi:peptide deformylase